MNGKLETFLSILEKEDKEAAVTLTLSWLDQGAFNIVSLYETILRPALEDERYGDTGVTSKKISIWKEHIRSGIIRTIIECCYPKVINELRRSERSANGKTVVVLCPDGETHEIGARMAADYFTLSGFHVYFVGSSTPIAEFLSVLDLLSPDYIAISVTNYFNLVSAKRTFETIRKIQKGKVTLLAGGSAFRGKQELAAEVGADRLVNSFEAISALAQEAEK